MKNFLANKHNVAVSAYITDLNPSQITTNGALTIIDNSDPQNHIQGLVPNSYSIFLDKLFLATGYGFSSYYNFERASYVVSTYANAYSYILHTLDELSKKTFNLEYSYVNSENKIDSIYNSYGWLTEYKELDVKRKDAHTYLISLNTVNTYYISNMKLEIIGGENIHGLKNNSTELTYNYFDITYTESAEVKFSFIKNTSIDKATIKNNAPSVYFDNELIDFSNDNIIDDGTSIYTIKNYDNPRVNQTKDITLVCKRNDDIIYSYTFINAIKWRYKILPFNTEKNNALSELELNTILALDNIDFSDNSFDITTDNDIYNNFIEFISNNHNKMVYLDDNTQIEFSGIGYKYLNNNQTIHNFSHDYILIMSNSVNFDFYFNGIKNNCWNYIEFNYNDNVYRLYQSTQRYIGKHIWTIKYNYE